MLSHQMVRLAGQELQQELALQRERLEGFRSLSPALRVRSSDAIDKCFHLTSLKRIARRVDLGAKDVNTIQWYQYIYIYISLA